MKIRSLVSHPVPLALGAALVLAAAITAQAQNPPGSPESPPANAAAAEARPGDPAAGRIKATTCTGCHGIPGYMNVYPTYHVPKVAGQHYQYLVEALKSYRSGERDHPTMHAQTLALSDQDIADIAAYFSSLDARPAASPATGGSNELAEKLCASCHGKGGMSTIPTYPILAGQYRDYLLRTLKDYKSGARQSPIMGGLVSTLSQQELRELAAYYAARNYLRTLEVAEQ